MEELNGIVYYKKISPYPNDKNNEGCGLKSSEIDNNFFFLRGMDISEVKYNNEGIISLIRFNGQLPLN